MAVANNYVIHKYNTALTLMYQYENYTNETRVELQNANLY